MRKIIVWYHEHKIIVQELIRAVATLPFWMGGLWYLQNTGVLAASIPTLLAFGTGISALQFSVLVVLRMRTKWKLQVARIRYMLIVILVVSTAMFIWRISQGEVAHAVLFTAGMLFLGLLTFLVMRRRGIKW